MKKGYTPMFEQYLSIKADYQDCILFYRLGDFYEMFFDDAVLASDTLDLALTGRDCGMPNRAPMCGIPYHAYETYLAKLIDKGHKVAICEQVSPPNDKGLVQREVVRIVTSGTVTESSMLTTDNNYLCSVYRDGDDVDNSVVHHKYGVSWVDITTAEFCYALCESQNKLFDILIRLKPKEIICSEGVLAESLEFDIVKSGDCPRFYQFNMYAYQIDFATEIVQRMLGDDKLAKLQSNRHCLLSVGGLLEYINHTQKQSISVLQTIVNDDDTQYMQIGKSARRTLELDGNARDGKVFGSLYSIVNLAKTDMGKRQIKRWINAPSINESTIVGRHDCIDALNKTMLYRDDIVAILSKIKDIERLAIRLNQKTIRPLDMLSLATSLSIVPRLIGALLSYNSKILSQFVSGILDIAVVYNTIIQAIDSQPNTFIRDGGVIAAGYSTELDELRSIKKDAALVLAHIEASEREQTGIKTLKVSYNRVFGYFIEIPKSQIGLVPYRYTRKQTTANSERYITNELKDIEKKVLGADDEIISLEQRLYNELMDKLASFVPDILTTAQAIATLDAICSFAVLATKNNYIRPTISGGDSIVIREGRHPVAETIVGVTEFVPNDTTLSDSERTMIITGPNMSGKSVYMRQVALIVLLAQTGCFVPAKECTISIIDKIFTRVGAGDDMLSGQSTFMVEMSEVAEIVRAITDRSLVLLDEVGRGTATYDGLSIAWAIVEHISINCRAKTIFSTHYHELMHLEQVIEGCVNYKMTVREVGDNIVFLRKLLRGSVNKSFGIEVAALSGIPSTIIQRANDILQSLEKLDITKDDTIIGKLYGKRDIDKPKDIQHNNTMDKQREISNILRGLDMDNISPKTAYDILYDLCDKLKIC